MKEIFQIESLTSNGEWISFTEGCFDTLEQAEKHMDLIRIELANANPDALRIQSYPSAEGILEELQKKEGWDSDRILREIVIPALRMGHNPAFDTIVNTAQHILGEYYLSERLVCIYPPFR